MVVDSSIQRIARLTPLHDVLALMEARLAAVPPRQRAPAAACGFVLAEDVVASRRPLHPTALRDGYAVAAAAIADANSYTPLPFASLPRRVDQGEALPSGTDAVLPLDAVVLRDNNRAEAIAAVAPGEGVLAAGGDVAAAGLLRRAGERLRLTDLAVLTAAGIAEVTIRAPRVRVACSGAETPQLHAAIDVLRHALAAAGATPLDAPKAMPLLDVALAEAEFDAMIAVGGTGSGRQDSAVRTLARLGSVEAHGIAVSPGESAAFGFVGARPVLLMPGRLDASVAVWLLIGRHLIAKLAGGRVEDRPVMLPLKRKVTSTIGLTELIPVTCTAGVAEPLASGYLSFQALARSDGWIVVLADSEGFAAGTPVAVRSWP